MDHRYVLSPFLTEHAVIHFTSKQRTSQSGSDVCVTGGEKDIGVDRESNPKGLSNTVPALYPTELPNHMSINLTIYHQIPACTPSQLEFSLEFYREKHCEMF